MRNRLLLGSLFQNMYKFSYLSSCFRGTSNDEEKLVHNDNIKHVSYSSTWGHFDSWALKVAHDNASYDSFVYCHFVLGCHCYTFISFPIFP